jgi:hypothetical protein
MKTLSLESIITFGKHHDKQVEDVIEDDPGWCRWLAENSTTYEFDNEALEALQKRENRRG